MVGHLYDRTRVGRCVSVGRPYHGIRARNSELNRIFRCVLTDALPNAIETVRAGCLGHRGGFPIKGSGAEPSVPIDNGAVHDTEPLLLFKADDPVHHDGFDPTAGQ